MTISASRGSSTSMSLRLCSRAPEMTIRSEAATHNDSTTGEQMFPGGESATGRTCPRYAGRNAFASALWPSWRKRSTGSSRSGSCVSSDFPRSHISRAFEAEPAAADPPRGLRAWATPASPITGDATPPCLPAAMEPCSATTRPPGCGASSRCPSEPAVTIPSRGTPAARHPSPLGRDRCRVGTAWSGEGIPVTSAARTLLDLASGRHRARPDERDRSGAPPRPARPRFPRRAPRPSQPDRRRQALEAGARRSIASRCSTERAPSSSSSMRSTKEGQRLPVLNCWVEKWEIDAYWEAERFAVEVDGWRDPRQPRGIRGRPPPPGGDEAGGNRLHPDLGAPNRSPSQASRATNRHVPHTSASRGIPDAVVPAYRGQMRPVSPKAAASLRR